VCSSEQNWPQAYLIGQFNIFTATINLGDWHNPQELRRHDSQFFGFSLQTHQKRVNSFGTQGFTWRIDVIYWRAVLIVITLYLLNENTIQRKVTLEAICIRVSKKFCNSLLFVRTGHPEDRESKPYGWAKNFSFSTSSSSLSTGCQEQSGYNVKLTIHLHLLP
jgi:hypothetical protein